MGCDSFDSVFIERHRTSLCIKEIPVLLYTDTELPPCKGIVGWALDLSTLLLHKAMKADMLAEVVIIRNAQQL